MRFYRVVNDGRSHDNETETRQLQMTNMEYVNSGCNVKGV